MLNKLFKSLMAVAFASLVVTGAQGMRLKVKLNNLTEKLDTVVCKSTDKVMFTQEDLENCMKKTSSALGAISNKDSNLTIKVMTKGGTQKDSTSFMSDKLEEGFNTQVLNMLVQQNLFKTK